MKKLIVVLLVAAIVLFGVSFALNGFAAQNAQREHLWLMQTILPGSESFTLEPYAGDDENIRSVHKAENGFVVEAVTYGYAGEITMLIGVNNEGFVTGLVVSEAHETLGIGSNILTLEGVEKLHGVEHEVVFDHINAGSFVALAAATGADLTIEGVRPRSFWMLRRVYERLGINVGLYDNRITVSSDQSRQIKYDAGGPFLQISDGPWPQFPTDMMSCTIVAATQCRGTVTFFEKMFDGRMNFVDRLIEMRANAIICDPHRVVITGPSELQATELASPDIRAGMALIIAALCAKGESRIRRAEIIYRGYGNLVEKLRSIGAVVDEED